MRYANQIEFKNTTGAVKEVIDALQDFPQNYHCYIRNVDSIYPITDVDDDALGDNELGFSSIETYGRRILNPMHVSELLTILEQFGEEESNFEDMKVFAEAATDIDPSLDMQLDTPRGLTSVAVDNVNKMVVFLTGYEYDFC